MAASPPDQPTTVNTAPNQGQASRHWSWPRLIIGFVAFILIAFVILYLLTKIKILPPQLFVPLLATLGPIGGFVNATLSDKNFQQSFRDWLTRLLFGSAGAKDDKGAGTTTQTPPQQGITINFSPTITNTNTATSSTVNPSVQQTSPVTRQPLGGATVANHPSSSEIIFYPNMKLMNPDEYYGRTIEREQLLSRSRYGGCTSIVGPRRSGKTWLMTYMRLVATEQLGANFHIGYMSAALPSTTTIAGFTREALKALGHPPNSAPKHPDLTLLEHFVGNIVAQKRTPILCIDEFEGLTHHPAFDHSFFEGLRAITEIGLGLVVLSKEPLIDLVSASTRTSPFFNVFLQLKLLPFERADAEKFLQKKGTLAQFSQLDYDYLLAYAQTEKDKFPPLLLQLVGETLLNDKRAATTAGQHHYRPNDLEYWQAFKTRVDETYRGAVTL